MKIKLVFVYHKALEVLPTSQLAFSSRKEWLVPELFLLWYLLPLKSARCYGVGFNITYLKHRINTDDKNLL